MNPVVLNSWVGVRACVIGGTGFLGYQIVKRLLDRGATVRILALDPPPDHPIRQLANVERLVGDIRDAATVKAATADCRVVFQAAGPVTVGGSQRDAMLDPHVSGTRTLLDHLPVGCRLIHTSSLVAIGGTRTGEVLTEESPFPNAGVRISYVTVKRAGEEVALEAAKRGVDVVAVNPCYLIGPEDFGPSPMGKLCVRFWRGRVPASPPGGMNFVDVRDAAEGHILAAERGRCGERYAVGSENLTMNAFLRTLATVAKFRPRWLPTTPRPLYHLFALGAELRGKLTGKEAFPSLEHVRLNRLFWYTSSAKAERELGYRPRSVAESITDAYHWHTSRQTLLPRGFNGWLLRPPAQKG